MTVPQIRFELSKDDPGLSASQQKNAVESRVDGVFRNVCLRYKLKPSILVKIQPAELAKMVLAVDERCRKTGVDAAAVHGAAVKWAGSLKG